MSEMHSFSQQRRVKFLLSEKTTHELEQLFKAMLDTHPLRDLVREILEERKAP